MVNNEHYTSKIFNAATIVFLGLIFSKLLSYIYVILLARLGSSAYGLLSLVFSIISFVSVLTLIGLKSTVLRFVAFYKGKNDNKRIKGTILSSIYFTLPLSIIASLIILVFSKTIALQIFHNEELIPLLRITAFLIPIKNISRIFLTTIQAFQEIKYATLIEQIIENIIKLSLTFLLIILGFNILGAIFAFIIASVATLILSFYYLEKKVFSLAKANIRTIYNKKELLMFSLPLLFSDFFVNIVKWIDTWFIGSFRTISEVGLYNAALPTANLLVLIPTALMSLFIPIITELYAKNNIKQIKEISKVIGKWVFFLNIPIAAFLIIFSKEILNVLFGKEYGSSSVAMIILALSHIPYSLSHIYSNILQMLKKTRIIFLIFVTVTIINLIINITLIPRYGMIGAAIGVATYFTLLFILMSLFVYKYKKIQIIRLVYLKSLLGIILSSLIIVQIAKFVHPISIINLLILSLALAIVYFIFLIIFKSIEEEDKNIINNIKNKISNKIQK